MSSRYIYIVNLHDAPCERPLALSQGAAGKSAPKFVAGGQGQGQKAKQGQAKRNTAAQRIGQQRQQQQQQQVGGRGRGRVPNQLQGVSFTDDISVGRWATEHETSIVDHYCIVCVCDHNRVCVLPGTNIKTTGSGCCQRADT